MGGSDYPINLLKNAGVDMSTSQPVESVINIFSETLKEMKELIN
jgi:oligoendopeptidase F